MAVSPPKHHCNTNKRQIYGSQSTQALLHAYFRGFICLPFCMCLAYVFGTWKYVSETVLLILLCSFSWWGSFLWLMKLNLAAAILYITVRKLYCISIPSMIYFNLHFLSVNFIFYFFILILFFTVFYSGTQRPNDRHCLGKRWSYHSVD